MPDPTITVLGVHRLAVTPELVDATLEQLHGHVPAGEDRAELEPYCRDLLQSAVLTEVLVENRDDRFSIDDFGQDIPGQPPGQRQAPWLETYLTLDGEHRLLEQRHLVKTPEDPALRVAFFIHFWEPSVPLTTSYGRISCPTITSMPARLAKLAPYEAPD